MKTASISPAQPRRAETRLARASFSLTQDINVKVKLTPRLFASCGLAGQLF